MGDFNGDATSDLLWRNLTPGDEHLAIWFMHDGQFSGEAYPTDLPLGFNVEGVGDFDGDGRSDILARGSSGQVFFFMIKDGLLSSFPGLQLGPGDKWQFAGIGDFDGDRKGDVLWRHTVDGVKAGEAWDFGPNDYTNMRIPGVEKFD